MFSTFIFYIILDLRHFSPTAINIYNMYRSKNPRLPVCFNTMEYLPAVTLDATDTRCYSIGQSVVVAGCLHVCTIVVAVVSCACESRSVSEERTKFKVFHNVFRRMCLRKILNYGENFTSKLT
jgi:hypothetical protein